MKTNSFENWFHSDSKLGADFAIYKGRSLTPAGGLVPRGGENVVLVAIVGASDLAAMKALCEVRTKDFNDLEVQLGSRPDDNADLAFTCDGQGQMTL